MPRWLGGASKLECRVHCVIKTASGRRSVPLVWCWRTVVAAFHWPSPVARSRASLPVTVLQINLSPSCSYHSNGCRQTPASVSLFRPAFWEAGARSPRWPRSPIIAVSARVTRRFVCSCPQTNLAVAFVGLSSAHVRPNVEQVSFASDCRSADCRLPSGTAVSTACSA